jgi:proteic killer suppression protein
LEVSFDDRGLAEMCASETELRKKWGTVRGKKMEQRLKDLRAAETLADMRYLPGRCHELTGNLAGQLSLDLDHPYRLLFRPAEETEPSPGGGLDWTKVTAVALTSITDTHT